MKIKNFIFKLKDQTQEAITIVGLGDRNGADKYVKKFALELGYEYREMNPAHTTKNLYSLMTESYYDKPYQPKNLHQQAKIFSNFVDSCVLFDDTNQQDKKVNNLLKHLNKARKRTVIVSS
jgi:3-deoxy-D-arabino-heptulosonate 7-phosphate (DAHP) synthase